MHVRIFVLISVRQAIDDLLRLLGRGRVIEIYKRLAIGTLGEDGEIRPYRLNIVGVERRLHDFVHVFTFRASSQAASRARNGSINGLSSILSMDSPPKASSSIALASLFAMPRDSR